MFHQKEQAELNPGGCLRSMDVMVEADDLPHRGGSRAGMQYNLRVNRRARGPRRARSCCHRPSHEACATTRQICITWDSTKASSTSELVIHEEAPSSSAPATRAIIQ